MGNNLEVSPKNYIPLCVLYCTRFSANYPAPSPLPMSPSPPPYNPPLHYPVQCPLPSTLSISPCCSTSTDDVEVLKQELAKGQVQLDAILTSHERELAVISEKLQQSLADNERYGCLF